MAHQPPDGENGRSYGTWRRGKYLFPCDEEEQDRLDIFHKFFKTAFGGNLYSVPLRMNNELRILDLGAGTCIWAIEVADHIFNLRNGMRAEVKGVDLNMLAPEQIPCDTEFLQMDVESPWRGLGEDSWDLIHLRTMYGSIRSWHSLYRKIHIHLRPGGWIEQVEIDWTPRNDDGSLLPNSPLNRWANELLSAMDDYGCPMRVENGGRSTIEMLEAAGFVDVHMSVTKAPINSWPGGRETEIGQWLNLGLTKGVEGLTLAPLTRMRGRSVEYIRALSAEVAADVCSRQNHSYFLIYTWTALRGVTGPG